MNEQTSQQQAMGCHDKATTRPPKVATATTAAATTTHHFIDRPCRLSSLPVTRPMVSAVSFTIGELGLGAHPG